MLVQSLNINDLQVEKMKPFDGTMVYAQNKRQQVVLTEQYAKKYANIHFSSMHPGWSDTPGIPCSIRIICLFDLYPLKPHFYMIKLGFTGVYIFF